MKCKGITDPTLAVVVDKIKKTVSACPCGLKYKELTDKVAEQTATTGASDICSAEIQKIIQGTVCLRTNMLVASVHSRHVICFSLHTHLATKLPVFLAFPHFRAFAIYRSPSCPTKQDISDGLACCRADLVHVCKDIADLDTKKQVSSIKTDSEKKCGVHLDGMEASPLSGKPQYSGGKNASNVFLSTHHALCDDRLLPC